MLKIADYAVQYHGAFPIWMGPFDAFLMTVHPSTVKTVLSGSGNVNKSNLFRSCAAACMLSDKSRNERNNENNTKDKHIFN